MLYPPHSTATQPMLQGTHEQYNTTVVSDKKKDLRPCQPFSNAPPCVYGGTSGGPTHSAPHRNRGRGAGVKAVRVAVARRCKGEIGVNFMQCHLYNCNLHCSNTPECTSYTPWAYCKPAHGTGKEHTFFDRAMHVYRAQHRMSGRAARRARPRACGPFEVVFEQLLGDVRKLPRA